MPEKKNQHLVPACYLRNFEADVSEIKKQNPKYSSGIYINDNQLSAGWKLKSIRHKSLTKPYFYNLPEDDPKQPLVENYLSIVESDYASHITEIIQGVVNNENMSFMSYFVTLQFMRVEAFIDNFQRTWNKVAEHMDAFEGNINYNEAVKDISKRQLVNIDLGHLIHQNSVIIYNETSFPFITSDNPVVRQRINIADASKVIPKRFLTRIDNESVEFTFYFFPLSPNAAYISCELIKSRENLTYSDADLENIFYLNVSSIKNSYKKVYSSVVEPIKGEKELSKILCFKSDTVVKIYTQSKRVICEGSIISDSGSVVSVKLADLQKVQLLNDGEQVKSFEFIENNINIRGMRDCRVASIDYSEGLVIIESNLKLKI